jgi:hypothetical protein
MGLLEVVIGLVKDTWNLVVFLVNLARGDRAACQKFYQFVRGPTREGRQLASQASRDAKNKFRPTRVVGADGKTRLSEQGEKGGSLYRTYATPLQDLAGLELHMLLYATCRPTLF